MNITTPALPAPEGINERKVRLYQEMAAGYEVLALWHSLTEEQQRALHASLLAAAAQAAANEAAARGGASR